VTSCMSIVAGRGVVAGNGRWTELSQAMLWAGKAGRRHSGRGRHHSGQVWWRDGWARLCDGGVRRCGERAEQAGGRGRCQRGPVWQRTASSGGRLSQATVRGAARARCAFGEKFGSAQSCHGVR
jgi:hypothetical protein